MSIQSIAIQSLRRGPLLLLPLLLLLLPLLLLLLILLMLGEVGLIHIQLLRSLSQTRRQTLIRRLKFLHLPLYLARFGLHLPDGGEVAFFGILDVLFEVAALMF